MINLLHALSNDNLSMFDNFVIWVNFFGACIALYFNYKGFKHGIPRFRRVHLLVAGLAAVYCLGYLILLLFDPSFLIWSSALRGVSILVWPIVWTLPALTSLSIWKELQERVIPAELSDGVDE